MGRNKRLDQIEYFFTLSMIYNAMEKQYGWPPEKTRDFIHKYARSLKPKKETSPKYKKRTLYEAIIKLKNNNLLELKIVKEWTTLRRPYKYQLNWIGKKSELVSSVFWLKEKKFIDEMHYAWFESFLFYKGKPLTMMRTGERNMDAVLNKISEILETN